MGPNGKPVVKLFFFFPKESYSLVTQDVEADTTQQVAGLDLFNTPSEHLPPLNPDGSDPLPRLIVAPLEAGGRPLLSPPNVPHCVLTVRSCVMVEQRKLSHFFMDEILYFLSFCTRWRHPPILYDHIKDGLSKAAVAEPVADHLLSVLRSSSAPLDIRTRAFQSLQTLVDNTKHFGLGPSTLERIRNTLLSLRSEISPDQRAKDQSMILAQQQQELPGVSRFDKFYAAHIHVEGRPRWGPLRLKHKVAREDRELLEKARKDGKGDKDAVGSAVDAVISILLEESAATARATAGNTGAHASTGPSENDLDLLFD